MAYRCGELANQADVHVTLLKIVTGVFKKLERLTKAGSVEFYDRKLYRAELPEEGMVSGRKRLRSYGLASARSEQPACLMRRADIHRRKNRA
jgi:hypothetical protein